VTKRKVCAWCGGPIEKSAGRDGRASTAGGAVANGTSSAQTLPELGLAESDLIVARKAMEGLDDLLFVLSCAITDVQGDVALDGSPEQLRRSLDWLLESARPLLGVSERPAGGT